MRVLALLFLCVGTAADSASYAECPVSGTTLTEQQWFDVTSSSTVLFQGGQHVTCSTDDTATTFSGALSYYVDDVPANPDRGVTPNPDLTGDNFTCPVTGQSFIVPAGDSTREDVVMFCSNQSLYFVDKYSVIDFLAYPSKYLQA